MNKILGLLLLAICLGGGIVGLLVLMGKVLGPIGYIFLIIASIVFLIVNKTSKQNII